MLKNGPSMVDASTLKLISFAKKWLHHFSLLPSMHQKWCRDNQHHDIQHNDTQHDDVTMSSMGSIAAMSVNDTQHKSQKSLYWVVHF